MSARSPYSGKRYETCPWCYKLVALRKDGTFWHHNGHEYDGMWGRTCHGVGPTPALPARATQHSEETTK